MNIITCVISLIFLVLSLFYNRKNKAVSPSVLFFTLWSFILFLSILNLYNIYKPTDESYFLIMLMLIFFGIGNLIDIFLKNKNIHFNKLCIKEKEKEDKILKPHFKIFYVLCFTSIIFNIIDIIIMLYEAKQGTPMWQIRNWSLQPFGSNNPILNRRSFIEEVFRSIILTPFATIIPPIAAYYFFNSKDKKQKVFLLIFPAVELISSSLAGGGGRLGFIYYFGTFLLAFLITYKNGSIKKELIKKYRIIVILILILGILTVILYTTLRTGKGNLIKQIYTYFALPPTLLSIELPDIKNVGHTFGMTTFFGVHSYFFRIFDTIGLDFLIPQIYNNAYTNILNAEIFKDVGYGIGNAFVTPIYYFYLDGGYLFVCAASLVFGYIVSKLHRKFESNITARGFTIYILIMYGIFLTFIRIQTAIPAYIISFIFALFIFKTDKIKQKNDIEENCKNESKTSRRKNNG